MCDCVCVRFIIRFAVNAIIFNKRFSKCLSSNCGDYFIVLSQLVLILNSADLFNILYIIYD